MGDFLVLLGKEANRDHIALLQRLPRMRKLVEVQHGDRNKKGTTTNRMRGTFTEAHVFTECDICFQMSKMV